MIYVSDLQHLISQWTDRMRNHAHPSSYRDAISECIYELSKVINSSIEEELSYQDFLSQQADDYLSTMEAHEPAA